ncbi:MAG: glycosyltransferase [Dehalococcoidia bacterium]
MKLLIVCSTIDLKYGMGATPFWWQLFKALHEMGNELIVIPYLGYPVNSLWWRTYPNPCARESILFNSFLDRTRVRAVGSQGHFSNLSSALVKKYIRPKWERHLLKVLDQEGDVDAVLFFNAPLNHMTGIPTKIKTRAELPIIYYDGDLPTSLPDYADTESFKFSQYPGADLAEYDIFLSSSKGAIPILKEMGARNVDVLYYGVDPELYSPIQVEQDIDIFYYGHRGKTKERRMDFMITQPSEALPDVHFLVGGREHEVGLGRAKTCGTLTISAWRGYCCRSKINLNITKEIDAQMYGTSSARPFELASLGCCVVSDPYNGLEEWFEVGKEMFMVHNAEEAIETYKMLLSSAELRRRTGEAARSKVLKEHTAQHRAKQLINLLQGLEGHQHR